MVSGLNLSLFPTGNFLAPAVFESVHCIGPSTNEFGWPPIGSTSVPSSVSLRIFPTLVEIIPSVSFSVSETSVFPSKVRPVPLLSSRNGILETPVKLPVMV